LCETQQGLFALVYITIEIMIYACYNIHAMSGGDKYGKERKDRVTD